MRQRESHGGCRLCQRALCGGDHGMSFNIFVLSTSELHLSSSHYALTQHHFPEQVGAHLAHSCQPQMGTPLLSRGRKPLQRHCPPSQLRPRPALQRGRGQYNSGACTRGNIFHGRRKHLSRQHLILTWEVMERVARAPLDPPARSPCSDGVAVVFARWSHEAGATSIVT